MCRNPEAAGLMLSPAACFSDPLYPNSDTLSASMLVSDSTFPISIAPEIHAFVQQDVIFSEEDVRLFAAVVADSAAVHFDSAFAQAQGYERPIVHGLLVASRFSRLMGMFLPGESSVIQSVQLNYRRPVYADTTVRYRVRVDRVVEAVGAIILILTATCADEIVCEGKAQCVLRRLPDA
jgi:3-hydroxybutyryl-CoA dehydratase